ncbi:RNA-binding protein [Fusibacter sp. JL216-2]|uniref:YlmH family RNA-binding protein n=1 Tax=Fusibacter sp. JL216-2 TaxID=3071453 RepID=UPI003D34D77C
MLKKDMIMEKARVSASSRQVAIRIIDLASQVMKKHEPAFSDFITPEDQDVALRILSQIPDVQYDLFGGYDDAEYQIVGIFPDWMMFTKEDFPLSVVDVEMKEEATHRSVLGSVLGLGIKRDKIGDILVYDDVIQVVAGHAMAQYISVHLRKIGRHTVKSDVLGVEGLKPKDVEYESFSASVKSLRLDAIVAAGFNIARGKAADLIKQERVKVNYRFVTSVSKQLGEGDLISVRGKGRIVYAGDEGTTRKDRIRVKLKRVK